MREPLSRDNPPLLRLGQPLTHQQRHLVHTYITLLTETGNLDIRVAEVVRSAGTSNAAFYKSFQSKDELQVAATYDMARRMVALVERAVPRRAPPAARIEGFTRALMRYTDTNVDTAAVRALALERHRLQHRVPAEYQTIVALLRAPLDRALVDAAVEPAAEIAEAMLEMLLSIQATNLALKQKVPRRKVDIIVRLVLGMGGLTPAAQSARFRTTTNGSRTPLADVASDLIL
jgi:AcrR family transcriptional regulator